MEETTPAQYSEGQGLFTTNEKGEFVRCRYVRHIRADIHLVKIEEGQYQGTAFKCPDEIFPENPLNKN